MGFLNCPFLCACKPLSKTMKSSSHTNLFTKSGISSSVARVMSYQGKILGTGTPTILNLIHLLSIYCLDYHPILVTVIK